MNKFLLYPYYNRQQVSAYLFSARYLNPQPATLIKDIEFSSKIIIKNSHLFVPVFSIFKYGLKYINSSELIINLDNINQGIYKIMAVHNFQVEDCNPNINECIMGILLSPYRDGKFAPPEEYPIECRKITDLGYVNTINYCLYD